MNDIIEPTIEYDFSDLYLGPPSTIPGGAYFTRIMYKNNKQLYIQTPKCLTKQGFVKSGKKIYTDLMFDNNDTVFINWIENLEAKCQELVFTKGENWFQTKLEKDDIESAFTSPFKIYKSGKFYLLRVNVKPNIKVFNETDSIINLDDITCDKTLISIIEIQGIKFSSRNFQIEIELKQSMVVSPDPFLDSCFIKKPIKSQSTIIENISGPITEPITETITENNDDQDFDNALVNNDETELVQEIDITSDITRDTTTDTTTTNAITSNDNLITNVQLDTTDLQVDTTDVQIDDNIVLEIEDLDVHEIKDDPKVLKEFNLNVSDSLDNNLESITLKKPNQVYYEIYKKAREKAKEAKKAAILAFLEAKNIKKTYMIDNIDESDDSDEGFSINDDISEINDL
jgi:hypothetical protein